MKAVEPLGVADEPGRERGAPVVADRPETAGAVARGLAWLLLPAALGIWLGTAVNMALDADESQHLQAAWLVAQGAVPFVDFWEHHAPTLYYLLAPLTRWLVDRPAVYLAGRAVMLVAAGTALSLVARLARRLSAGTAVAAVLMLGVLPRFVERATEVRPDGPALVAWLAAVLALVRWRERGKPAGLSAAGFFVGVAIAFTPKSLYAVPGLALAVVLAEAGAPGAVTRIGLAWLRLAAGAAVPLLGLMAALWWHGGARAWRGLAEHVVGGALTFVDFTKEAPVTDEGLGFLALAGGGILLAVREHGRQVLRHPLHGPLLLPAATTVFALLLPRTPAVYRHAWLPVLAVGSVYAGHALAAAVRRARRRRAALLLAGVAAVAGVVGPASISIQKGFTDGNSEQFRLMRLLLAHACPGEPVLDGTGLFVFRPAAHRYRVLIGGVREWIATGAIPEERIVEDVRASRPRVALADRRLRALIGPMADFLQRYYVPTPEGLLVAGAAIHVRPHAARRAEVDLLLGETYRLTTTLGLAVTIDGAPAVAGLLRLDAGRHVVRWIGSAGTIALTTLSCAERRARGEAFAL